MLRHFVIHFSVSHLTDVDFLGSGVRVGEWCLLKNRDRCKDCAKSATMSDVVIYGSTSREGSLWPPM